MIDIRVNAQTDRDSFRLECTASMGLVISQHTVAVRATTGWIHPGCASTCNISVIMVPEFETWTNRTSYLHVYHQYPDTTPHPDHLPPQLARVLTTKRTIQVRGDREGVVAAIRAEVEDIVDLLPALGVMALAMY